MLERNLVPQVRRLLIPPRYQFESAANGLSVRRYRSATREANVIVEPFRTRGDSCKRLLAQTDDGESFIIEFGSFHDVYDPPVSGIIRGRVPTLEDGLLILDNAQFRDGPVDLGAVTAERDNVRATWLAGINYKAQLLDADGNAIREGLRSPQAGALHAIAAHWTLGNQTALVVMPTGTGKTEVMMATAVAAYAERVLVIVPSDPLRQQAASKFETYGLLKKNWSYCRHP